MTWVFGIVLDRLISFGQRHTEDLWQREAAVAVAQGRDRARVARRAAHQKAVLAEVGKVLALLEDGQALQATPQVAGGRMLRHRNSVLHWRPGPAAH